MTGSAIRSLPVKDWPEPDRHAWAEACRPGVRLQSGGRASHLKPVTRGDLEKRYGLFLDFLARSGRLPGDRSATDLITPAILNDYIAELQARVSSVTVHGAIYKLRRMAQLLDPALDVAWMREIESDLHDRKRPIRNAHRLVFSHRLIAVGLNLFEQAELGLNPISIRRAQLARNGLLIALLATCPIRLKNLAALELSSTFVRQGNQWWIVLAGSDTKSGRPDHRIVPDQLTKWIDAYLERYRPAFPSCGEALWPSQKGGALSPSATHRMVTSTTRSALGVAVNPHMFRKCATYTIASIDGSRIDLASALLHHADARTTGKHYNLGLNVESSKTFAGLITDLRTRATIATIPKTQHWIGDSEDH